MKLAWTANGEMLKGTHTEITACAGDRSRDNSREKVLASRGRHCGLFGSNEIRNRSKHVDTFWRKLFRIALPLVCCVVLSINRRRDERVGHLTLFRRKYSTFFLVFCVAFFMYFLCARWTHFACPSSIECVQSGKRVGH